MSVHSEGVPSISAPIVVGDRLDWQSTLFAERLERRALSRLHASWPLATRRIRVHRNHAVEPTLSVVRPFLEYIAIAPEFVIGDYDDSLGFLELEGEADVELVWLDFARFSDQMTPQQIATWLLSRLRALRTYTVAPILVVDWDGPAEMRTAFNEAFVPASAEIGGVQLADRAEIWTADADAYFDAEREVVTGTRVSREGGLLTARLLGARWLPALLRPRLKAVVVDLDNTLYSGVLSEDGIAGVEVTGGHRELGRQLLELRASGIFLGVASRNEVEDVRALFASRTDLPVSWDDFSAASIAWQPKSQSLREISESLRIAPAAVLFVDDNAGELLEVLHHLPALSALHASEDGRQTALALEWFPGLFTFGTHAEDHVRIADMRANEERERALAARPDDLSAYYRELEVRLTVAHDRSEDLPRIAELSAKTNQFNLAFRRLSESELRAGWDAGTWHLATVALRDRLSDSGIIAVAVTELRGDCLLVHELCVSCRAMGRRLEDLIVAQMLTGSTGFDGVREVSFAFRDGPRSQPARIWLQAFVGRALPAAPESIHLSVAAERIKSASINEDVAIEMPR